MSGFPSRAAPFLGLVLLLCARVASADTPGDPAPNPCPQLGDIVAVFLQKHELWLCQEGSAVARFRVALGRGGIDKRREGDGRTPVGIYTFGTPRPSAQFGVFIPIDYPREDQLAQGFTGGNVGIHGPPRGVSEPEYPITTVNWTRGCIATALDADIEFIAEFVRILQPILVIR